MPKLAEISTIASDDAPISVVQDLANYEKFACQINYGVGTGTTAVLQVSLDGINFVYLSGSSQALDNAGGTHIWNVSDAIFPWLKVAITGDAVGIEVIFAGDPRPRRD